jgi:hypothetical protein
MCCPTEANADGLTNAELDDIEPRLKENMPEAVKHKVGIDEPDLARQQDAVMETLAFKPGGKLEIPALQLFRR